jgi:hypothetical protein
MDNEVFLALEESGNRVKFFQLDEMNELEILLDTLGTKPCQSIGAYAPGYSEELFPRLIYIDNFQNISVASVEYWGNNHSIMGPYI